MTTTQTPKITFKRWSEFSHTRYYVHIDGEQVGWTLKSHDGSWSFYSTVEDPYTGKLLASGYDTRRDAAMEGICRLEIHHCGRQVRTNSHTFADEVVYIEQPVLKAAWTALLDEKYPEERP